ncbi:hypothetical protein GCM10010495_27310 [Kitasatospora herbaricolor]|nr:hypothetical protein GCM10010495_27310 [Kitasatospora herbaricolor]
MIRIRVETVRATPWLCEKLGGFIHHAPEFFDETRYDGGVIQRTVTAMAGVGFAADLELWAGPAEGGVKVTANVRHSPGPNCAPIIVNPPGVPKPKRVPAPAARVPVARSLPVGEGEASMDTEEWIDPRYAELVAWYRQAPPVEVDGLPAMNGGPPLTPRRAFLTDVPSTDSRPARVPTSLPRDAATACTWTARSPRTPGSVRGPWAPAVSCRRASASARCC